MSKEIKYKKLKVKTSKHISGNNKKKFYFVKKKTKYLIKITPKGVSKERRNLKREAELRDKLFKLTQEGKFKNTPMLFMNNLTLRGRKIEIDECMIWLPDKNSHFVIVKCYFKNGNKTKPIINQ